MKSNKIVYEGLKVKVYAKAAFIDACMKESHTAQQDMMGELIKSGRLNQVFRSVEWKQGSVVMETAWDDGKKEEVFDILLEKRIEELKYLPQPWEILLKPVLEMEQDTVCVDSLPFLTYAIVKNENCTQVLNSILLDKKQDYYGAYQRSAYREAPFFKWFLLEEQRMAKLILGFFLVLREQRKKEMYELLMKALYTGYKGFKNVLRKSDLSGSGLFSKCMENEVSMELILSKMMVLLCMAEDKGILIKEDYYFYLTLDRFICYESVWREREEPELDLERGREVYKELVKNFGCSGFYMTDMTEQEEEEEAEERATEEKATEEKAAEARAGEFEKMETLFQIFDLELRMFWDTGLERRECEKLCCLLETPDPREYWKLLLIAVLCKYIGKIQSDYNNKLEEEKEFQYLLQEEERKLLELRVKELEEQMETAAVRKQQLETALKGAEERVQRADSRLEKLQQRSEEEKAELTALRNFMFQMGSGESSEQETEMPEERIPVKNTEKIIVVGGHRHWQRKMKEYLPGGAFLSGEHLNFNPAVLSSKNYIVFNTDILKHGLYYKVMSEKKKGQKVLYVHGNNIRKTFREIIRQMEAI